MVSFPFFGVLFLLMISIMPWKNNKANPATTQRKESKAVSGDGSTKRITAAINSFVDIFIFILLFSR